MKKILLLQILLVWLLQVHAQEGTLDPTFAGNGVKHLGINYNATAFQSDGKLIGVLIVPGGFYLTRYDTNGNLDPGFCCGGMPTLVPGIVGTPTAVNIAIQNNDNIVVQVQGDGSGSPQVPGVPPMYHTLIALARFSNNGVPDASFGSNGLAVEDYQAPTGTFGPFPPFARTLGVQGDGKIVEVLYFSRRSANSISIGRFNSDGTRDSSFSIGITALGYTFLSTLIIGKNDEIVAAGSTATNPLAPDFLLLMRFNSDGTPGGLFNLSPINFNFDLVANAAVIQSDGKIIVAVKELRSSAKLLRFHPNGNLDSTFGDNGIVITRDGISQIIIQHDGKILVNGSGLTRYNYDGSIDASFGINGFSSTPHSISSWNITGNRLYAYGNAILAAYQIITTCIPPTLLNNDQIVLNASCGNSDGNLSIIPISGIAPFMYSKDGGANYIAGADGGYTFENLAEGIYYLRLKDAAGCQSAIVQRQVRSVGCPSCPPRFLNNDQIALGANCGANDGNISIIPTAGTAPFMYSIDGGSTYVPGPDGGYTFENLSAGIYQLRLKSATGCESVVVQREVQSIGCPSCTPPVFLNNDQIVLAASCGNNDGNISIIPTSGIAPFMYSINGGSTYIPGGDAGYTFENLTAGVYQLRLKDATGCESSVVQREVMNRNNCAGIAATSNLSEATLSSVNGTITTYPNPSRGQFRLQLQNFTSSKAEILVFDSRGSVIHKRPINITGRSTFDFDLSSRAKGIYYIKIVSNSGIKFSKVLLQ